MGEPSRETNNFQPPRRMITLSFLTLITLLITARCHAKLKGILQENQYPSGYDSWVPIYEHTHAGEIQPKILITTLGVISHMTNVKSDGNCGFRSAALALGKVAAADTHSGNIYTQSLPMSDPWMEVRSEMIKEMELPSSIYQNSKFMKKLGTDFETCQKRLCYTSVPAPQEHWMTFPIDAYILADTYRRPVVVVSQFSSYTYLPLSKAQTFFPPIYFVFLENLKHIEALQFSCNWPAPLIHDIWERYATKKAQLWKPWIRNNLELGASFFQAKPTTKKDEGIIVID